MHQTQSLHEVLNSGFQLNFILNDNKFTVDIPIHPIKYIKDEVKKMAINVPMIAYPNILPKFLKKYFYFKYNLLIILLIKIKLLFPY